MTRLRFCTAAAALVLAAPLSAQQLSLRLGGLAAQYADSINDQAGALSVRLAAQSRRTSGAVDASWAQFGEGEAAGQAWGRALFITPAGRSAAIGLRLDALANTIHNGPWSGTAIAEGFGTLGAGAWSLTAGASAGRVRFLDGGASMLAGVMAEAAVQAGPWTLAGGANGTTTDTLRLTDYALTASWRNQRLELGAFAATRVGDLSTGAWGQVWVAVAVSPAVALEATVGSYPKDLTGFDEGRFANLGLRVFLRGAPRAAPAAALAPLGAGESPPSMVTVVRLDSASVRATFTVAPADSVSIAGTWNDWSPAALVRTEDGRWTATLPLAAGAHRFALLVDGGRWLVPAGVTRLPDDFGGEVGLLIVR